MKSRPQFRLRYRVRVRPPVARIERPILRPSSPLRRVNILGTHVWQGRPQRTVQAARPIDQPAASPRLIVHADTAVPAPHVPPSALPSAARLTFQPDPYLDYGRFLTPEGGILFVYKDHDTRLRHTLWRLFAWTAACYGEWWYVFHCSPVRNDWLNLLCLIAVAVANWFIVRKPVEIYRHVEVRPDCMIIEDADVFWVRNIENGIPTFQQDKEGNQILSGIYGTRFVEYLTVRRFDEQDRMAEVFASHLQEAMTQLWTPQQ